MKKFKKVLLTAGGIIIAGMVINSALFVVDQTQYCIVTRFGNPIKTILEPGLYGKLPDPIDTLRYFERRLQFYETGLNEYLTADKKNVVVDSYICWKIIDPQKYWQAIRTEAATETILREISDSAIGAALGTYPLSEFISVEPDGVKIDQIMAEVTENCNRRARRDCGLEIVDTRLKQLTLPKENIESVFRRMQTERERMAKKYRSEGREEAIKIRAEANKEKKLLLAATYKKAEKIRGEGEATAMKIYANAFKKDENFYKFIRSLEAYEKVIDDKTTLVLSLESEFLKFFSPRIKLQK